MYCRIIEIKNEIGKEIGGNHGTRIHKKYRRYGQSSC